MNKAGRNIYFAWSGGINRGDPHYYRVQTPSFLIEFDDTQDNANHIHSVWRDFTGDFGEDLLQRHYLDSGWYNAPNDCAGDTMKRRGVGAFLICLALFFAFAAVLPFAVHAQARREPRTLSGNVYIAGGNQPAENISVELHSNEGAMIAPQITDSNGWFEFHGLERTVYAIVIHEVGFAPINLNFDLFFNSSRGNVIYLVPMEKKRDLRSQGSRISAHELSMPQKARELMQSGRKKLYQDNDAQGSVADFQSAIAVDSDYYEAWFQIGMAQLTLGKTDEAEKSFRKSIEQSNGAYGDAQIGLGTVMLDKGNFIEGEKVLRRGVELSPDSWTGYYELGRAMLSENRIPEAKEAAELARSLAPSAPIIYRLLSNIHLREKNYTALLQDLDAYIQLDPDSPAGVRAKLLREQVQQKIAAEKLPTATSPNP